MHDFLDDYPGAAQEQVGKALNPQPRCEHAHRQRHEDSLLV